MSDTIDIYLGSLEVSKEDIRQSIINKGVTPEGGLTSYAKAIDDIYVPSTGNASVEYNSNGDYTINPQEYGYDALSGINVNVKVESSGGSGKPMIPNGFYFENSDIGLVDFSQYDWSLVYDTTQFFYKCKNTVGWDNFEQHFNGKVMSGYNMFYYCENLTSVPQMDTSNVTNMSYMFSNCENLTSVPLLDTSKVTNMGSMFYYCSKLTSVPLLDTSKVTNMSYMFSNCENLTSVPQLDISNATNMVSMFQVCTNLIEVRFKGQPTSSVSTGSMFYRVYTTGTLYYDSRYDYSKIINVMPSTWTAVPYDVEEYESQL